MSEVNDLFMQAMQASLNNEKVQWKNDLQSECWLALFQLAEKQHVLPMIYEAVYSCSAAQKADQTMLLPFKQRTVQTVMLQTMKTSEFLTLYQAMVNAGLTPIVVKGIICRNLYPNPDYRISGDEDILVPQGQFQKCHEIMLTNGMECADTEIDIEQSYEVPYGKKGSPIYIEAHKFLFSPDSEAYGELNSFFEGVEDRAIEIPVDGVQIRTMGYTDHLFYLICHAFKHFLHSGFGIRQVCDIIMMANAYGKEIDWVSILEQTQMIHADLFAASVFKIGEKYLTFDPDKAAYPEEWRNIQVDEEPMLEDLLSGGIYGATNRERLHSSTVTLNAVAARKKGKSGKANIWKSVFPSAKSLSGRYPYLRTKPFLLPIAWINRLITYKKELDSGNNNSATNSIKIGEQRVELLRQYGILDSD